MTKSGHLTNLEPRQVRLNQRKLKLKNEVLFKTLDQLNTNHGCWKAQSVDATTLASTLSMRAFVPALFSPYCWLLGKLSWIMDLAAGTQQLSLIHYPILWIPALNETITAVTAFSWNSNLKNIYLWSQMEWIRQKLISLILPAYQRWVLFLYKQLCTYWRKWLENIQIHTHPQELEDLLAR